MSSCIESTGGFSAVVSGLPQHDHRQRGHYALWVEAEAHDEVSGWLAGLSESEWDRGAVVIDRLGQLGHRARMPLSRSLGGGLFELRLSLGATARRIT